jgi:hypothetical protein
MFKRSYRKMNKAGEEAGGGSPADFINAKAQEGAGQDTDGSGNATNTEGDAGSEGKGQEDIDYKAMVEQLAKEKESLVNKNQEILGKLKSTKEKVSEYEKSLVAKEKEQAEADGNTEKLLEIARAELEKERARAEELSAKEQERREKLLIDAKKAEFLKALGSELHNPSDLKDARLDLVVQNEDGSWNTDGIKQAVEDFRTNHGYKIKSTDKSLDQGAAKGATQEKELSFAERAKKAGLLGG